MIKDNSSCLSVTPDSCVEYTGSVGSFEQIKSGMNVRSIVEFLINELIKISGDENISSQVSMLVEKLNSLNSSDITTNSALYTLVSGNLSTCGAQILNKSFSYTISKLSSGVQFTYNLSDVKNSLPDNIVISSVSVIGTTDIAISGGTTLVNLSKISGGFLISVEDLPLSLNFKVALSTSCGPINLTKKIHVSSLSNLGTWVSGLDIEDNTGSASAELKQDTYNELLASKISDLERILDELTNFKNSSVSGIIYPNTGVISALQTHALELIAIKSKLQEEPTVTISGNTQTLASVILELEAKMSSLESKVGILEQENETLKARVESLESL